jgi:hypothetical protein
MLTKNKIKIMETPYLYAAIRLHEGALRCNMLSDGGKKALKEFKAIKKALTNQEEDKNETTLCSCGNPNGFKEIEEGEVICSECGCYY